MSNYGGSSRHQGNYGRDSRGFDGSRNGYSSASLPARPPDAHREHYRNDISPAWDHRHASSSSNNNIRGAHGQDVSRASLSGEVPRRLPSHASLPARPSLHSDRSSAFARQDMGRSPSTPETARQRSLRLLRQYREQSQSAGSAAPWTDAIARAYQHLIDDFEKTTGKERIEAAQSIAQCCGPHLNDDLSDRAANSIFDLCEDEEVELRKAGYRALGDLSNADPARLTKRIVDALVTLLQYENEDEYLVVTETLIGQICAHPLDALSVIVLDHCLSLFRPICLRFLAIDAAEALRQGVHGDGSLEASFGQSLAQVVPHADNAEQLGHIAMLIGPLDTLWMTRSDFAQEELWRICSSSAQMLLDTYAVRLLRAMYDAPDEELYAMQRVDPHPPLDPAANMNLAGTVLENLSGQCYSYASTDEFLTMGEFAKHFYTIISDQTGPTPEQAPPIAFLSPQLRLAIVRITAKAAYGLEPRLGLGTINRMESSEIMAVIDQAANLTAQLSQAIQLLFPPQVNVSLSSDSLELVEALLYAHSAVMKVARLSSSGAKKLVNLNEDPNAINCLRAFYSDTSRRQRESAIAASVYGISKELLKNSSLSKPLTFAPLPAWMSASSAHFVAMAGSTAALVSALTKVRAEAMRQDQMMAEPDDVMEVDSPANNDAASTQQSLSGTDRQSVVTNGPAVVSIRSAAPIDEGLKPVSMRSVTRTGHDLAVADTIATLFGRGAFTGGMSRVRKRQEEEAAKKKNDPAPRSHDQRYQPYSRSQDDSWKGRGEQIGHGGGGGRGGYGGRSSDRDARPVDLFTARGREVINEPYGRPLAKRLGLGRAAPR